MELIVTNLNFEILAYPFIQLKEILVDVSLFFVFGKVT